MRVNDWDDEYCPDPDELDCCEHGVGFDEECEGCEDDPIGCLYPGKCIMVGTHLESECATAEMMEQISEGMRQPTRNGRGYARPRPLETESK